MEKKEVYRLEEDLQYLKAKQEEEVFGLEIVDYNKYMKELLKTKLNVLFIVFITFVLGIFFGMAMMLSLLM